MLPQFHSRFWLTCFSSRYLIDHIYIQWQILWLILIIIILASVIFTISLPNYITVKKHMLSDKPFYSQFMIILVTSSFLFNNYCISCYFNYNCSAISIFYTLQTCPVTPAISSDRSFSKSYRQKNKPTTQIQTVKTWPSNDWTDTLSFSFSPYHPNTWQTCSTCRRSYVIVPCLHSRKLPDNKFNSRLQVLIDKVGGLSLGVATCLERREEEEVRRDKTKTVLMYTAASETPGIFTRYI